MFRDDYRPVALAIWAGCNAAAAAKLGAEMIEPQNRLSLDEWNSGDPIWLVDMIVPFADNINKHGEHVFADLVSGPLADEALHFHQTDMAPSKRTSAAVAADAGEKSRAAVEAAVIKAA
ncbi:toxin-activating lysine-acyltransferase [Sphingorhabdus profundilacus]|uniref:toxin-activating lysine-acyltransferase n=1 Tax=Sphingorhabdus profundilacus TaxID=2509718 RepID=UPI0013655CD8|nr:toxin-activating lysine-acyltransferase [Sphingorhabdus profundilacus]